MTTQTRRHTRLLSLLGVRYVAVAINKLDLVGFDRAVFDRIADEFYELAAQLDFTGVTVIPVSALRGDNVVARSAQTPFYDGPTLMEWLHDVPPRDRRTDAPFRMPVSYVIRPDADFRGIAGQIVDGTVRVGDEVMIAPAGARTRIKRIVTLDGDLDAAGPEHSVTLVFDDEVDASRGDVVCAADRPADVCDQLEVELVWMDERELVPGRTYQVRLATRSTGARLSAPTCAIEPDSGKRIPTQTLSVNEIGIVNLALDRPVAFDVYRDSRDMGGCLIIDRMTRRTVAAGMVTRGLRRATNIQWQSLEVDKAAHAALKGHRSRVLWMTGLSGAGKTTIASLLESRLHVDGVHTCVLDGDNVRHGLSRDLGFGDADRDENIRRVAEVANIMVQSGLVVIVAFISPFREQREAARRLFEADEFVEVYIDAPLGVAEARDPKGLYRKARAGELCGLTGVDSDYEAPEAPEIHIDTTRTSPEAAAQVIIDHLREHGLWD
jgi:bifunctional enzyme CysN/CysC